MQTSKKQIKTLIGAMMSNDDSRMEAIIREIAEGIVPEHEENILQVFIESLRGDTDV